MTSKHLPVWLYAGPCAGTVVTMTKPDALFAESHQFGEILHDANPRHGIERGPHRVAEQFHADRSAQGYRDRQMRAREPAPAVPDPVADRSAAPLPQRSKLAKRRPRK
jgi:hypothetical protein